MAPLHTYTCSTVIYLYIVTAAEVSPKSTSFLIGWRIMADSPVVDITQCLRLKKKFIKRLQQARNSNKRTPQKHTKGELYAVPTTDDIGSIQITFTRPLYKKLVMYNVYLNGFG